VKNNTKIILILSAALFVFGAVIFTAAMAAADWDFSTLNTEDFSERYYEISERVDSLNINAVDCDVWITESPDELTRVTVVDSENIRTEVEVKNNTLYIQRHDKRTWFQMFGIFGDYEIDIRILVCLPRTKLNVLDVTTASGDVKVTDLFTFEVGGIHTASGDIETEAQYDKQLVMKTASGSVSARNFDAESCEIGTVSGDISLNDVICGVLTLQTTSGDVSVSDVKCAASVDVNTTSGDIRLENITADDLITQTTSGETAMEFTRINKLTASSSVSGNIEFRACDSADFNVSTTSGDVSAVILYGKEYVVSTTSGVVNVPQSEAGNGKFIAKTVSGDISIHDAGFGK